MSMVVLVSLLLVAASVHHGVMTGFEVIALDSVLPLQVCVNENTFCWLSCPFVNQCKYRCNASN